MDEAVEDGIGEGRLADDVVPGIDGKLAGDQRGAGAVSVLDDLHEVAALAGGEPVGSPVVEDQQVRPDQAPEQSREVAVAMGELELGDGSRL